MSEIWVSLHTDLNNFRGKKPVKKWIKDRFVSRQDGETRIRFTLLPETTKTKLNIDINNININISKYIKIHTHKKHFLGFCLLGDERIAPREIKTYELMSNSSLVLFLDRVSRK